MKPIRIVLNMVLGMSVGASCTAAIAGGEAHDQKDEASRTGSKSASECIINCVKPHAAPEPHSPRAEAPDVMTVLEDLVKAYTKGDIATYEQYIDDQCTVFDSTSNQMVIGKGKVTAYLKKLFEEHAPGGAKPLASYTIDHPYIKVTGNMAVVTYRAVQEIGGKNASRLERLTTNVFVKDGDAWKLVHERGDWQKLSRS